MKKNQLEYMMSEANPDCDLCHGLGRVIYRYQKDGFITHSFSYWGTCTQCFGVIYSVDAPPRNAQAQTNGSASLPGF